MGDIRSGRVLDRIRSKLLDSSIGCVLIPAEEEVSNVRQVTVLVALPPANITAEIISEATSLIAIVSPVVGVDHIDIDSATAHQVAVLSNHVAEVTHAQAEATIMLFLAARFRLLAAVQSLRAGWQPSKLPMGPLRGSTVGLVGFGRIASAVLEKLGPWDVRVLVASGRQLHGLPPHARQCSLEELLTSSDVVSLHGRLTDRTSGQIGDAEFELMKDGAVFVNTARAALVDEGAAVRSAASGRIFLALDVFSEEPLPMDHALRNLPNTILTPHCVGHTESTTEVLAENCLRIITQVLDHRLPTDRLVNKEMTERWGGFVSRGTDTTR